MQPSILFLINSAATVALGCPTSFALNNFKRNNHNIKTEQDKMRNCSSVHLF